MKLRHLALAGLAAASLEACSQQESANALAPANDMSEQTANGMSNHMGPAMRPQGPFAQSEGTMHRQMIAAVGVDAADTWVRKMIEHHQGAVDMSREVLALGPTPEVRRMAEVTIERQSKEIEELRALVRDGPPSQAAAQLYMAADNDMMRRMMTASGANPSDAWTRKMIEHHRGAVAMSDIALDQSPPAEVRRLAEQTKVDQGREIAELERMLQADGSQG